MKAKRIKESITQREYKKLMDGVRGSNTLRSNTKTNLLRAFTVLYFSGLRLNEVQQLTLAHVKELIEKGETKLLLPKTKSERKLYTSRALHKALVELFGVSFDEPFLSCKVIAKGSVQGKKEGISKDVFIKQVNSQMKSILGNGYTSHSFRQGLISEMGAKGVNVKIIAKFIGHSDVKTTMRYIKPTDDDVRGAMVR